MTYEVVTLEEVSGMKASRVDCTTREEFLYSATCLGREQ